MSRNRTQGSHVPKREKPSRELRERRSPDPAEWLRDWKAQAARHPIRWRMGLAIFVAAAVIIAVAAVMIGDLDERDYARCMEQAVKSYQAGDYDSALSSLRRAESISYSDECLMLMADCYEAQGNLELELEVLRRLDTTDESISQRILDVERRRAESRNAEFLYLAGREIPRDITSLVLDGLGITDADLEGLATLHRLSSLSLADNDLKDISALAELSGLVSLNLNGNRVEDLSPLSEMLSLRSLYLDDDPVRDLSPLYALTRLASLSITGLEVSEEQRAALSAALPNCAIHSAIPQEDVSDITIGGVSFLSNVQELDLSGKGIADISVLSECKDLRILNLSGNGLADLSPLMNLPALESLNVADNEVGDLRPLIGMASLRSVNAANNQLTDTAAAGAMGDLTELDLSGNLLTDFSGLEKLQNLRRLNLSGTGLTTEDLDCLKDLDGLVQLYIEDNQDLTGEAVDALRVELPNCAIYHSQLIYTVQIGGLSVPDNSQELNLSGRELTNISSLSGLYQLRRLDLSGNSLEIIAVFQYAQFRETLEVLDLSGNAIVDLTPLSSLTALRELDLANNQISDLSALKELKSLESLDLRGNLLSAEQIRELRLALPGCSILADE